MSLYYDIIAANIPTDNHESDLYVKNTPEARAILDKYPMHAKNAKLFTHADFKESWIDVPFAFDPFWEQKIKSAKRDIEVASKHLDTR